MTTFIVIITVHCCKAVAQSTMCHRRTCVYTHMWNFLYILKQKRNISVFSSLATNGMVVGYLIRPIQLGKLWTVTPWSYTVIMFFNLFYCFMFIFPYKRLLLQWNYTLEMILVFVCFNASGEIVIHFSFLQLIFWYGWFYCLFLTFIVLSFEKADDENR